jgi:glycosyltransferase involved in cell wall biosynthesis
MKISVITIAYNNESDIRATIESVVSQTYNNIEYIVVDGKSTDKTLEVINEYKSNISKLISEPDKNLYDAINKGIKMATGDIVGLVHAGDRLYDNQVLEKVANHFQNNDIDISYGHSKVVNENDKPIRINKSPEFKRSKVTNGWMPSHQSIYARRALFDKYGYYRTDLGGAGDYEWFIRYFYANSLKIKKINEFIVRFAMGGMSTRSYSSKLKTSHKEIIHKCWTLNNMRPPVGIIYKQWLRKPKQFILALIDK